MNIARIMAAVAPVVLVAAGFAFAQGTAPTGNAEAGEKTFNQCKACHSVKAGENRVGPSLNCVVGRKSGEVAGFNYSAAMKSANMTWDAASLDKYLADPKAAVPGNKMAFAGLKKPEDRANVIAYLEHECKK